MSASSLADIAICEATKVCVGPRIPIGHITVNNPADIRAHPRDKQEDHCERRRKHFPLQGEYRLCKISRGLWTRRLPFLTTLESIDLTDTFLDISVTL